MSVKVRVLVCRVGQAPSVEEIDDSLAGMQSVVDGHVARVFVAGRVAVMFDEDAPLVGKPPNTVVINGTTGGYCEIRGDFFVVRFTDERMTSITNEDLVDWGFYDGESLQSLDNAEVN